METEAQDTKKKLELVRVLPLRRYLNDRAVPGPEIIAVSHADLEDEDRLVYIYRKVA